MRSFSAPVPRSSFCYVAARSAGAGRAAKASSRRRSPSWQLLVGFAVAALALQMVAIQWLWVAVLETLKRAFGVLGSVTFGKLFFDEPVTPRKLGAAALMVAGTTLLAFV